MSNFNFTSQAAPASDLAAKQAAFRALPQDEQARIVAQFDAMKARAAAIKMQLAGALATRAIRTAKNSTAPQ